MNFSPRLYAVVVAAFALSLAAARPALADDAQAETLVKEGRAGEATAMLHTILSTQPNDARAHQLLCRVYYSQELIDQAIHECETSASEAPNNAVTQIWLGRAYGYKASHASPFSALGLAKKVHTSFERAYQLDPDSIDIMDDLGEFYADAPGIVGGGTDKAEALAQKVQARNPAESHRIRALAAEKKKDYTTAEAEYKAAVDSSKVLGAYNDLAKFYLRQNQKDRIVATLQPGIQADHQKDSALVGAATILISANLDPDLAEKLLRQYLASPYKTDASPAFKVHLQLGKLLAARGDSAGAHREYAAALALAPDYAPARKAAQGT